GECGRVLVRSALEHAGGCAMEVGESERRGGYWQRLVVPGRALEGFLENGQGLTRTPVLAQRIAQTFQGGHVVRGSFHCRRQQATGSAGHLAALRLGDRVPEQIGQGQPQVARIAVALAGEIPMEGVDEKDRVRRGGGGGG